MNLAIIPARSGSKRIPDKNIKDFYGKPLLSYSIKYALDSGVFDEVMVSTDSQKIKNIAIQNGAKVPFLRSEENSSDFATTANVIEEVILNYASYFKLEVDSFCCIYPTSPLLGKETLINSFKKFKKTSSSSLISVCKFSFPIQRALKMENEVLEFCNPEFKNTRSQDLPSRYHDAGQFYWGKAKSFLENRAMITENTIGFELPELEVQDIDNPSDWELAELKYKKKYC
ncbi:MAG: pseudaminic acid cytidylyltransferase [Bacteriovoracaceae bacterium]|nr:pseudaminic acid cytidylyltransferase [Bacteriovoracaceae bacterium]